MVLVYFAVFSSFRDEYFCTLNGKVSPNLLAMEGQDNFLSCAPRGRVCSLTIFGLWASRLWSCCSASFVVINWSVSPVIVAGCCCRGERARLDAVHGEAAVCLLYNSG